MHANLDGMRIEEEELEEKQEEKDLIDLHRRSKDTCTTANNSILFYYNT